MTKHDFRTSRARVVGQPRAQVAWLVIEDIYDELNLPHGDDPRIKGLTDGQRALFELHWVQSEIRNGGFEQLAHNSTGRFMMRAPGNARQIGADDYADVFDRFIALFPDGVVPEKQRQRRKALREVMADSEANLGELEDDFFALLAERDIYDQMGAFVATRPADFFVD